MLMQYLQLLERCLQSLMQCLQSLMLDLQMQVRRYAQVLVIVAQSFVNITGAFVFKAFIILIKTQPAKGMFFVL